MTPEALRNCLETAARCCEHKNASAFAALFSPTGEIHLPHHKLVGQAEIARVTAAYFTTCGEIKISIHRILVEGNFAAVEWTWQDGKSNENAIMVEFQEGLIQSWREYRRT